MRDIHEQLRAFLDPFLTARPVKGRPLVILTWAQSLDAKIGPADRTPMILSSLRTKYMTHLIRRRVDAILIGAETAVTDNPSLNGTILRHEADHSPNPLEWVGRRMDLSPIGRTATTSNTGSPLSCSSTETIPSCFIKSG